MTWRSEGRLRYRILDDDDAIIADLDSEEDARVVAAAPELLEELKATRLKVQQLCAVIDGMTGLLPHGLDAQETAIMDEVRRVYCRAPSSAITKAEGRDA